MSGIQVESDKRTYSILVNCPKCGADCFEEASGRDDKFLRVYALKCLECATLYSMNVVLRTERTSNPSGRKPK